MVINGVNVDYVGEYEYPYILRKYKGYAVKVVSCIGSEEIRESEILACRGYLALYILRCSGTNFIRNKIEKEKSQFHFKDIELEIEKSILDIKDFKGLVLVDLGENDLACCNDYRIRGNSVITRGLAGNYRSMIDVSLSMYNRRITGL